MRMAAVVAILSAVPIGASAQDVFSHLPVGARVRLVVPEVSVSRPLVGQVAAAGNCLYVRVPMGAATTIGIPLNRVTRIEVDASESQPSQATPSAIVTQRAEAVQWVPVDLDEILENQGQLCQGNAFTRIIPLRTGVLIRP
jgi:hypothetical protein